MTHSSNCNIVLEAVERVTTASRQPYSYVLRFAEGHWYEVSNKSILAISICSNYQYHCHPTLTVLFSEAPVVGSSGWEHEQQDRDGDGHTGVSYVAEIREYIFIYFCAAFLCYILNYRPMCAMNVRLAGVCMMFCFATLMLRKYMLKLVR